MDDIISKINGVLKNNGKEVELNESEANAILKAIGWEEIKKASNATEKQSAPEIGNDHSQVKGDSMKKKNPNSSDIVQEDEDSSNENSEELNENEVEFTDEELEALEEASKNHDEESEDNEEENEEDSEDEDKESKKKSKKKVPFFLKKKNMKEENDAQIKEHVDALLSGQDSLTEEFKEKAKTIFEAALAEREQAITEQIIQEAEEYLNEQLEETRQELVEHLDGYLNYIAEEWLENNALEVDTGLKSEISESFIEGLRNLFLEHNIDVPEETPELLDQMQEKIEELESSLNEEMLKNAELNNILAEHVKQEAIQEQTAGLNPVESDKFKKLAEAVEFTNADEFSNKLQVIKESYITKKPKSNVKKHDDLTELNESENNSSDVPEEIKILSESLVKFNTK